MKTTLYSLLAAAACGMALGQTAYTTPVGYYEAQAVNGGNIYVPSLVNTPKYAGSLIADTSTTLTVAANSLTANAFDEGAVYATHYVEITSGPNAGVALDIESNTTSVITLAADASALNLVGTETIKVRAHVTLKTAFPVAQLVALDDSATFYGLDGNFTSYTFGGFSAEGWTSDFTSDDGDLRPIPPGTGIVLTIGGASKTLTVSGEVKASPTVVQLGGGVVNIVGPQNPLVGTSSPLNSSGFNTLVPNDDSITAYVAGPLVDSVSYTPLGDVGNNLSSDFVNPTTDTFLNTTGLVVIPALSSAVTLPSGFTVAP